MLYQPALDESAEDYTQAGNKQLEKSPNPFFCKIQKAIKH